MTRGELEVRSYVIDSIEIYDDEEQLEAGKAVTMVSESVKLNKPVMHFQCSFGSVQYNRSVYNLVKGHGRQISEVRTCRPLVYFELIEG